MKSSKFPQRLNDFPPILCRLLARNKNGPPLTAVEIADRSTQTPGVKSPLVPVQVENISQCINWEKIHILDALAFMYGCRVDLTDAKEFRRIKDYLSKKPNFRFLRQSPEWKSYWLPLMKRWRKSHGIVTKESDIWPPLRDLLMRTNLLVK